MKYKVGDKVRIKGTDIGGVVVNIKRGQLVINNGSSLMGEWPENVSMIGGLAEENKPKNTDKLVSEKFNDSIIIKEPKYNKLSINTEFCDDKVELVISPDFELKQEGDKWFAIKKKKEYPKTYEECCEIMHSDPNFYVDTHLYSETLGSLYKLLISRDAYWKLYGEEIGLGKPWEPSDSDYITGRYCIFVHRGNIICDTPAQDCILTFPTPEMRDFFKKNFNPDIEFCKELL